MSIAELDSKGRLTLSKRTREALGVGDKVLVINAGDHLKIIPLPSDPLQVLHGALTTKKSFKELRRQAELTGAAFNRGVSGTSYPAESAAPIFYNRLS